jgi:hypothetical protein
MGRDSGGDSLAGLDGYRKGRSERSLVVQIVHHHGQLELANPIVGHGQANQAAAESSHEINGLGCDQFCRHAEIPLVLPVGIVYQDHHLAGPDVLYGPVDPLYARAIFHYLGHPLNIYLTCGNYSSLSLGSRKPCSAKNSSEMSPLPCNPAK